MIDKCSCGATCSQVEELQLEIERLNATVADMELRLAKREGQVVFADHGPDNYDLAG